MIPSLYHWGPSTEFMVQNIPDNKADNPPKCFWKTKKTQKALICPQPKVLGPLMKKRQRQKSLRRHIVSRPKSTVIFSPGDYSCLFDGSTLLDSLITLAKKSKRMLVLVSEYDFVIVCTVHHTAYGTHGQKKYTVKQYTGSDTVNTKLKRSLKIRKN